MKDKRTYQHTGQRGFMNIGLALGISLVVVAFMAPLGLYYLNMYNQNERARLKTEAQEVVEGLGKMIYSAYTAGPVVTSENCGPAVAGGGGSTPGGDGHGQGEGQYYVKRSLNVLSGQNRKSIVMTGRTKNMNGNVGGAPPPPEKAGDINNVAFCLPPAEQSCMELGGRNYCFSFAELEIAENNILDLPVHTRLEDPSIWDHLRGRLDPVATKTAQFIDRGFRGEAAYREAYAQAPSAADFNPARLVSKFCYNTGGADEGDPATLSPLANHCVSCNENGVVCVRYSMCVPPGSSTATIAREPADCGDTLEAQRNFLQGMVAMFPDRR